MAASMGIRTARVDALTFGLGSGIAGIAGVALSQIDNVSPNLGQAYIIDSFMVVVFGGVGNLWGTLVGALTLGIANKFLEPFAGAVLAKILVLVFIILFIQKRPARTVRAQGPGGRMKRRMITRFLIQGMDRSLRLLRAAGPGRRHRGAGAQPARAAGLPVPRADLSAAADRQVPVLRAAGAGARPGLGLLRHPQRSATAPSSRSAATAMGMYLMRQIGTRGVYGNPVLPDFMVFLNWKELPWFWYGFDNFRFAMLMVMLVPGLLAFVFGWLAFRCRVTGVYLSIITQALTYALMLAFFRNDMGLAATTA